MMDERTYRRLFTETKLQTFLRHNYPMQAIIYQRKCSTCNPYGAIHAPLKCTSRKSCNDGWRSYRRTR